MAEEAAFLESMQVTNDSQDTYKMDGGRNQQQAGPEYEGYDPSQKVETQLLSNAQDLSFSSSHDLTSPNKLSFTSAPPLTSTSTSVSLPQQDLFASDRQSLSRSMSPASSQSLNNEPVTRMQHNSNINGSGHSQEGGEVGQSEGKEAVDICQKLSLPSVSGPDLNISTNGVSADNIALQNDVQDQSSSSTVQNGATDTVPNLAAVLPDTGAGSHSEFTAKPAETLPAPLITAVPAAAKAQPSTPSTSAPRARLPHDTIGILEDRIKADPRGDIQAWLHLLNEHKKRGKTEDARSVYERFLSLFPSAVRFVLEACIIRRRC